MFWDHNLGFLRWLRSKANLNEKVRKGSGFGFISILVKSHKPLDYYIKILITSQSGVNQNIQFQQGETRIRNWENVEIPT